MDALCNEMYSRWVQVGSNPPAKQKTIPKEIFEDYGTLLDTMEEMFD
jgi:hypothetical protein